MAYEVLTDETFTRDMALLITGWLVAMLIATLFLLEFGGVIYG